MDRPTQVLIVDDNDAYRRVARAVVNTTHGFTWIGEAADGHTAHQLVADALAPTDSARPLDELLILVDVNLGADDGIALTAELIRRHPGLQVALVSTLAEDELPLEARTCGAVGFVPKGVFGPDSLAGLLAGAYAWAP